MQGRCLCADYFLLDLGFRHWWDVAGRQFEVQCAVGGCRCSFRYTLRTLFDVKHLSYCSLY